MSGFFSSLLSSFFSFFRVLTFVLQVQVIEEAVRYIEELHTALVERFRQKHGKNLLFWLFCFAAVAFLLPSALGIRCVFMHARVCVCVCVCVCLCVCVRKKEFSMH